MIRTVWVTSSFTGFHCWKDAPEKTEFLRNWHRHIFHVKLGVQVNHGDREVEFFDLKERLDSFLQTNYHLEYFYESCEQIAEQIINRFQASFVEVSEDGENGARLESTSSDFK